jgi:hypothetical protein
MQVGSLVVHVRKPEIPERYKDCVKWLPIPDSETVYCVRALHNNGRVIVLEEGVIGVDPLDGEEIAIIVELFKEVQPPMSLTSLMEEVEEMELFAV